MSTLLTPPKKPQSPLAGAIGRLLGASNNLRQMINFETPTGDIAVSVTYREYCDAIDELQKLTMKGGSR